MKKTLISVFSLALVGLMAYTLYANKQEMQENAKLAEVTSESIPVQVTKLSKMALENDVTADGTLTAVTDLTLLSETQGKVIKVYKEKGDRVQKNELLAEVENELLQAQTEAAKANYEKLKADFERFTKLSESDAVTKRQLEDVRIGMKSAEAQYRSAKKNLENTYIKATASGEINDDFVQEGAFISGGMKLYEIVDASKLKLNVKLTANEILNVQEGDRITITTEVYPNESFDAIVTAIAAKADAGLRYNVEVELSDLKGKNLKPGMYAKAHFKFTQNEMKFYLDRNALVGSIQEPQVFVVQDSVVQLKSITVGQSSKDLIEVIDGLNPENQVVLTGQINLDEGTKVSVMKRG